MSTQLEKWKEQLRQKVREKVEAVEGTNMHVSWKEIEEVVFEHIDQIATQSAEARDEEWRKAISNIIQNSEGSQDWFNGLRACKSISFPPTTS